MSDQLNLALVGFGTIGSGVVKILQDERKLIEQRTGVDLNLKYVVDKDFTADRGVEIQAAQKVTDYRIALEDSDIDVVIELVGGVGFANILVEECLKAGKNVVTANKALIAEKGMPLLTLAKEKNLVIGYEASVAGGIPIIRTVSDALAGDRIQAVYGIVNGTTNYILTKMIEENEGFADALKEAQRLGFAEADPTLDIEGFDAAHKIAILGAMAFNCPIRYDEIAVEGITGIQLEDVKIADELGYVIKLLAIAKIDEDQSIELRVNPSLIPRENQLAAVRNEFNAILVESASLGDSMYYGKGAGSLPTATAVVADLIDLAKFGEFRYRTSKFTAFNDYDFKPMGEIMSRYYLRFGVMDQPGVLSHITGVFGEKHISISTVNQKERKEGSFVPLILTTHLAKEQNILDAIEEIAAKEYVRDKGVMIRIVD